MAEQDILNNLHKDMRAIGRMPKTGKMSELNGWARVEEWYERMDFNEDQQELRSQLENLLAGAYVLMMESLRMLEVVKKEKKEKKNKTGAGKQETGVGGYGVLCRVMYVQRGCSAADGHEQNGGKTGSGGLRRILNRGLPSAAAHKIGECTQGAYRLQYCAIFPTRTAQNEKGNHLHPRGLRRRQGQ